MRLPFGLPNLYRDSTGNINLEWRVWDRWFIEAELINIPTASQLVGEYIAVEVEDFLDEEHSGPDPEP